MNILSSALHPTFDALSAHADQSDVDGARTRTGRHVVRCAGCAATVSEIRALGQAARAIELPAVPDGLWARIERESLARAAVVVGAPHVEPRVDVAVADRAIQRSRSRTKWILAGAAAAALLLSMLWPVASALQATGTSRLTVSPGRPAPGGVITVRYRPLPRMTAFSDVVLVGKYLQPAGRNPRPDAFGFGEGSMMLGDSLATLHRTADGWYEGRVVLPRDFLAVRLVVVDPAGTVRDAGDGYEPWIAIGGTSSGEPSLGALLAVLDLGGEGRASGSTWDAADSLRRYFPDHPAGWAYSAGYGQSKGRFDLIRFFENAQHRYASVDAALWPRQQLDAEHLHDMVVFARRIDEPAEAMKWTTRLVREHPEDPRALDDLVSALHEIELRQPHGYADSVRAWIPTLDSIEHASRNTATIQPASIAAWLIGRYGDSATVARWAARYPPQLGPLARPSSTGAFSPMSDAALVRFHSQAARRCERPAGSYPLHTTVPGWTRMCERSRATAWGLLGRDARARGNQSAARAAFDSAGGATGRGYSCSSTLWGWDRALIALQAGDTAAAERFMIAGAAWAPDGARLGAPNAQAYLGGRFDAARWTASVDSAHRADMACERAERADRLARGDPLGW